jgi:hypothetical protein
MPIFINGLSCVGHSTCFGNVPTSAGESLFTSSLSNGWFEDETLGDIFRIDEYGRFS